MSRHEILEAGFLREVAKHSINQTVADRLCEIADRLESKPENQTSPINQITITQNDGDRFNVRVGDKSADQLTFDEMLGLVTSLTMPLKRPCLRWLKTDSEQGAEGDNSPW